MIWTERANTLSNNIDEERKAVKSVVERTAAENVRLCKIGKAGRRNGTRHKGDLNI